MIWNPQNKYSLSVGFFLAVREIRRNNLWTSTLIILVISLTFFNMLFLGGILIGFASASLATYPKYYSGDVFIIPEVNKTVIEDTNTIVSVVKTLPTVKSVSVRESAAGLLEYDYGNKLHTTDIADSVSGTVAGIDPLGEEQMSQLSKAMVAGSYLTPDDADEIIIGSNLIQKYATVRGAALAVGSRILK